MATAAEGRYLALIASMRCLICVRWPANATGQASEVHHIASGSGKRSHFATAPLCPEHHRGSAGLHGLGTKAFVSMYRVPGETEYGLLVWVNEDLEKMGLRRAA